MDVAETEAMILTPKPFDAGDKPFDNDPLDRGVFAQNLTRLVSKGGDRGIVISLSAPWGQGKTTFCKHWCEMLSQQQQPVFYFNAWKSDYCKDPLIAFMGFLQRKGAEAADPSKAEVALKVLRKTTATILKASAKIAVNYATANALEALASGATEDAIDAASEAVSASIESKLIEQSKEVHTIAEFKTQMSHLVQAISNDGKPVVFVIDELDRCRPSFAIELLEQVKHLFSVPNAVFVLAVDREQLAAAASALQGFPPESASGYLRRFIDLDCSLPEPSIESFCAYQASHYPAARNGWRGGVDPLKTILSLSRNLNLSLRSIERVFTRVDAIMKMSGEDPAPLLASLIPAIVCIENGHADIIRCVYSAGENPERLIAFLDKAYGVQDAVQRERLGFLKGCFLSLFADHPECKEESESCMQLFEEADSDGGYAEARRSKDSSVLKKFRWESRVYNGIMSHPSPYANQAKIAKFRIEVAQVMLFARGIA